jgi:choline dehydrogenase
VLGGCSSINGMIYQRGQKGDYDNWCETIQNESGVDALGNDIKKQWSFSDMEKYFDQHLDYADELALNKDKTMLDDDVGFYDQDKWGKLKGGEWHVEKQRLSWNILDDFKKTAIRAGFPELKHFNNSNKKGCGYFQVMFSVNSITIIFIYSLQFSSSSSFSSLSSTGYSPF